MLLRNVYADKQEYNAFIVPFGLPLHPMIISHLIIKIKSVFRLCFTIKPFYLILHVGVTIHLIDKLSVNQNTQLFVPIAIKFNSTSDLK